MYRSSNRRCWGWLWYFSSSLRSPASGKRQQAFCCFNVLHFGVVHLPLQLDVLQHRSAKHKDQQDQSEHGNVGQRQPERVRCVGETLLVTFAHHEAHPTHRVEQFTRSVSIHFPAQPGHLHIDHIIERCIAGRLLPDIAGEHFARYNGIAVQ